MIPQHLQETVSSAPPQFVCIDCAPTQSHAENRQPNPFSLHAQRVQAANNELQQNLRDKGIEPRRHTINDFEHVILTQLNLQLEGQNLTPTEVLRAAFPADSGKAESIGKSAYHQLWRRAYASPRIAGHTVVLHMLKVIGQRDMNLRSGARTFAHSLSVGALLFKLTVETHASKEWKDNLDQTKQRYHALDQLAEAPPSVQARGHSGTEGRRKGRTEIAQLLGMKLDNVNYYLRPRTERKAVM